MPEFAQCAVDRRRRGRQDVDSLVHHSDRGQCTAVRYTQRLTEAGAVASVGSKGDSYHNALAEAFNSAFKAELNPQQGPPTSRSPTSSMSAGVITAVYMANST